MAKKLKVELEVDSAEARRKAKEVAEAAAGAPAAAGSSGISGLSGLSGAPVDVPVNEPKPVDVPVNEPKPVDVPVNEPKPVDVKVNEPKPVDVKVNEPKPVKVPVEKPETVKVPVEPTAPAGKSAEDEAVAKAAKKAADGLDKAGRAARGLSNGADETSRQMRSIVRSFAGLGVGMSINFARQFVDQGSAADKALNAGGNAATLGFMGWRLGGPWGAAAGAALGAGKGLLENWKAGNDRAEAENKQADANLETMSSWRKAREETLAFKAALDRLTDAETALADRRRMVADEIRRREEDERKLSLAANRAAGSIDATNPETLARTQGAFARAMADLQGNAARLDELRGLQERLAKEPASDGLASHAAPDALSRLGGYMGGGVDTGLRDIARTGREQLAVLKSIESKSGKGATWQ